MQNKKDDTTFWNTGEDSDDDFEKIINSKQTDTVTEITNKENSVLSSEKMDFMWSDDENEFILKNEEVKVPNITKENIPHKIQDNFEDEKNNNCIVNKDINEKNEEEIYDHVYEITTEEKLESQERLSFDVKKLDRFSKDENINSESHIIKEKVIADRLKNNFKPDTENIISQNNLYDLNHISENKGLDSDLIHGIKNLSIDEKKVETEKELTKNIELDFLNDCNEEDEDFFSENFKCDKIEALHYTDENINKDISSKKIDNILNNNNEIIRNLTENFHDLDEDIVSIRDENIEKQNLNDDNVQEQNLNDENVQEQISNDENSEEQKLNVENFKDANLEEKNSKDANVKELDQTNNNENIFDKKPILIFLNNRIFTYYRTKQKRYSKEGQSKEQDVNIFTSFKLNFSYTVKKIDLTSTEENKSLKNFKELFLLSDIHGDSIAKLIKAKDVTYCTKSITETYNSGDINAAFNIANVNSQMAVDYCINKKMWTLALILSKNDKDIVFNILNEFLDENSTDLVTGKDFIIKGNWVNYFKHFINTKYSNNHEKYIREVFNFNYLDGMFVLVSFHLCKIIDLNNYLYYFSHNPYLLEILIHVNDNLIKIKNIDLLYYQHIIDIKDRNLNYAKEFYKQKKKDFNKNLQASLDDLFKLSWNFGIKDVLSFGINKILDVKEVQDKRNEVDKNNSVSRKNILPKKSIIYNKPKFLEHKKEIKITNETKGIDFHSKNTIEGYDQYKENDNKIISKKNEITKQYHNGLNENLNKSNQNSNERIEKTKEKICTKNETNNKSKDVYSEQKHSKSFADFFENDKEEKEATTEDDTSLFLSKYNIEDDDKIGIKKPIIKQEEENSNSFFNIFGLFKKKSYKIDLQATDDIKYDPVTKKWVTNTSPDLSNQSNNSVKSIPVPKSSMLPSIKKKVSSQEIISKQSPADIKKMSLYAGKKKSSVSGFNTLKKDNNQN